MDILVAFFLVPALVCACFGLLFSLGQLLSPERIERARRACWPLQLNLWHLSCAVAVAALLMLALQSGHEVGLALFALSVFTLAWFVRAWSHEFVFLMGLRDEDLPGRNDKLIWAFLLFAFAPIAVWFFRSYRLAHWPEPAAESSSSSSTETAGKTVSQPAGF